MVYRIYIIYTVGTTSPGTRINIQQYNNIYISNMINTTDLDLDELDFILLLSIIRFAVLLKVCF
jgi:hypothetical protein